jgi:hypothetical protein
MATKKTTTEKPESTLAEDAAALLAATAPAAVIPPLAEPLVVGKQQEQQQSDADKVDAAKARLAAALAAATPAKKFYEAHNSNRLIKSQGLQFQFSPYQHSGGTWMGTYAAEKPNEIAALDALVAEGKSAVYPLTEEEYANCQKKKAVTLQGLGQSLIHSEVQAQSQPSANPADTLNTEPAQAPVEPPVESVDSLAIGESKMPEPAASA